MDSIDIILDFLKENPGMFSTRKKKNKPNPTTDLGSDQIKDIIVESQKKKVIIAEPTTTPDPMVFHFSEMRKGEIVNLKHFKHFRNIIFCTFFKLN
tara:strand:+ start:210 stop:497 length:288 start_codon:yes stop_codon:yes gene_type:complete